MGYGSLSRGSDHIGMVHRLIWEALYGPVPDGYELDHVCQVTRCANPHHLELVTCSENNRRRRPWRWRHLDAQRITA